MSIIPEVKCRRCGESFSALRSRCPACGTRRVTQSSRTPDTTPGTVRGTASYERASVNTKWQLIFGLILVVAVILAVIVMVSTGLNDGGGSSGGRTKTTPTPAVESVAPTPEAAPTPSPTPTPTIQKLEIRYTLDGKERKEVTMKIGEKLPMEAIIIPTDIQGVVKWTTDNEDLVSITVDPENPNKVTLECLAFQAGGIKVHAEVYGVKTDLQIYMNAG
ncbi:MAG: hypothetical protein IJJ43_00110 [Oscillospiraceae bacterium]|nr:hypothetical protein [Oscillospiraceae bacterium]